jgi:hypothetical protein
MRERMRAARPILVIEAERETIMWPTANVCTINVVPLGIYYRRDGITLIHAIDP